MITDNFQTVATWNEHTQADGSNIGGTPPKRYGFVQGVPNLTTTGTMFYTDAGGLQYTDVEFYTSRPVLPNNGKLQLNFWMFVGENGPLIAQAYETDTILCIGGWNYNLSLQVNNITGQIQIADATGGWVNIPLSVSSFVLPPLVWVKYSINYVFDTVKKVSSVTNVAFSSVNWANGYNFNIPLQNTPAQQKNWTDGALFQVQLDTNASGGRYSIVIDNANYVWS